MLFCVALTTVSAASKKDVFAHKDTRKIGVIGASDNRCLLTPASSKKSAKQGMHKSPAANTKLEGTSYGFLDGPDGKMWTYTQENVSDGYNYKSSVVTVYNSKREKQGQFTIDIPSGIRVNMVEPFGLITTKLFDTNANTKEVLVYLHQVGNADNNYKGTDRLYVYNLNGDKVTEFVGDGIIVDASPNEWTLYQRLILTRDNEDGVNTDIEVYRSPSWGDDGAVKEKTISIDTKLINYSDGPFINFVNVGGKPYFVLSHYDQPFVEYDENGNQLMDEETFMPYFTEGVSYVIEAYDKSFNKVSEFSIPCVKRSDDYLVRMMSFGAFSNNDMSAGYFSGDGKLNFIVCNEDVTMTTEYVLSFDVYDQDGNLVKSLADNVGDSYKKLADIKGQEESWMFLSADGASLFTVDLPSCTRKEVPSKVDEYSISFNMDRVACNNEDGYEYIMAVNEAKTDETMTNVIASFAYLNPDYSVKRYVDINLGPKAMTFLPLVAPEGLDPYLFNTDNQREFLFFSKMRKNEDATNAYNVLFVANEQGEILHSFGGEDDADKGDIWSASVLNYGTESPMLFVNFYDWDNDHNTMMYYDLPMVKFSAGGDGSAENPYCISSVGDLAQIKSAPAACYKIVEDFDAFGYPVSLPEFGGVLDGDGKVIYNLDVTSDAYYGGLFNTLTGATVKNLVLYKPVGTLTSDNQNLGLLAGYCVESNIDNVSARELNITSSDGAVASPVGGLVGLAAGNTVISNCYLIEPNINVNASTVGAIAGETRTSTVIKGCAVASATISGRGEVGGITGIVGNGCTVSDCSVSDLSLTGNSFLGGIAGRCGVNSTRGTIVRCVVNGEINAANAVAVGGITGTIEPDWNKESTTTVSSNVTNGLVISTANGNYDGSLHRIVGMTVTDEVSSRKEDGLSHNYVCLTSEAAEGSYACTSQDDSSVEGKDVEAETLATLDFWTTLGYALDGDAPLWVMGEDKMLHLAVEDVERVPDGIHNITTGNNIAMPALSGCYTLNGQRVAQPRRGLYIINGRKVAVK